MSRTIKDSHSQLKIKTMNKYFLKTSTIFDKIVANDTSATIVSTIKHIHYRCASCYSCGLNGDDRIHGFLLSTKLSKNDLRDMGVLVSSVKPMTIIQ